MPIRGSQGVEYPDIKVVQIRQTKISKVSRQCKQVVFLIIRGWSFCQGWDEFGPAGEFQRISDAVDIWDGMEKISPFVNQAMSQGSVGSMGLSVRKNG